MNLIRIIEQSNGTKAVSARELYNFLEVKERFSNWFDRQLQYGFNENVDYVGCKVFNTLANQTLQDYALSLDTAKEISMIQRSDKGKQARQYFIECEKRLKEQALIPKSYSEALKLAYQQAEELEIKNSLLEAQRPLVLFAQALQVSDHCILVGEFAKILKQNGVEIGANRLFEYLRANEYLIKNGEQRNLPTQRSLDLGLFKVKTTTINNPDGSVRVNKTTKITPKGQEYFTNKLIKKLSYAKNKDNYSISRGAMVS